MDSKSVKAWFTFPSLIACLLRLATSINVQTPLFPLLEDAKPSELFCLPPRPQLSQSSCPMCRRWPSRLHQTPQATTPGPMILCCHASHFTVFPLSAPFAATHGLFTLEWALVWLPENIQFVIQTCVVTAKRRVWSFIASLTLLCEHTTQYSSRCSPSPDCRQCWGLRAW